MGATASSAHPRRPGDDDLLVASFSGVYRIGAQGNPDAELMCGVVHLGRQVFHPRGIVLDLRLLDYQWGDMIDAVLSKAIVGDVEPPVVVSDRCRPALTSLLLLDGADEPEKWLFDDLDEALRVVESRIQR